MGDPRAENTTESVMTTLAAMDVEDCVGRAYGSAAGKLAGVAVQPAVWIFSGTETDAADWAIWAGGVVSGAASAVTGVVKAWVDGEVELAAKQVAMNEPADKREGIRSATEYGFFEKGPAISSTKIANAGGTTWTIDGQFWVYIVDGKGRLVPDYSPAKATMIRQPEHPLKRRGSDFAWHTIRR
jgi:hypothetical protein